MTRLTRARYALSLLALVAGAFYFQPPAGEAFTIASGSPNKINFENGAETNAALEKVENEISNPLSDSSENNTIKSEKMTNARSFRATAYCLKGRTAVGGGVRRGVVAADPRILPLGTRIYINAGAYSGDYIVADTGGAVRGRILDVWVPTCAEALHFGRKNVSVSVTGK